MGFVARVAFTEIITAAAFPVTEPKATVHRLGPTTLLIAGMPMTILGQVMKSKTDIFAKVTATAIASTASVVAATSIGKVVVR